MFATIENPWFRGLSVALRIFVVLALFRPYRDLETGDTNLCNRNGETGNRTPELLFRKHGA